MEMRSGNHVSRFMTRKLQECVKHLHKMLVDEYAAERDVGIIPTPF